MIQDLQKIYSDIVTNSYYLAIAKILLLLLFAFIVNKASSIYMSNLSKKSKNSKSKWKKIFIQGLGVPLKFIINAQLFFIFLKIINSHIEVFKSTDTIYHLKSLSVILGIAWFILKIIKATEELKIAQMTADQRLGDRTTARAISKLFKIILFIVCLMISLDTMGINISGIVTIAGVGTAAIGFASKDLLANFFGALIIHLDRPFVEGDWISSPEKQIEGVVEEVSWRMTKIRTFDKRPIFVPNSIFTNIIIQNDTNMLNRRIKKSLTLRYDDLKLIQPITKAIKEYIENSEYIDQNQNNNVYLSDFLDYSVNVELSCYTYQVDSISFRSQQQQILLDIADIIQKHNADFAFPTTVIISNNKA
jgi:MscS family membrane protein